MRIAGVRDFTSAMITGIVCTFFFVMGMVVFSMSGVGLIVGALCFAAGLAAFGVSVWATAQLEFKEREQQEREIEMRERGDDRVPSLFELSSQALPPSRAWEYLAKACGVDPKDQSEASRNMVVSKLIESNPDGLESQPMLNAAVRSASLSQMLAAAYAARAWTSLLEICELNTNGKPIPQNVETATRVVSILVQKYPLGPDARIQALAQTAYMLPMMKEAYYREACKFFVKHELLDWGPMSSEAREQLASTLVERFPNGLEPDVAFHVESVSLSQRVEELYAAKARDERSPSTPRDREWLLER